MDKKEKSFGLWSAVFLWIWSMVWAWIFVLLWEAWAVAWNAVWISFILWWIIALLSWYSLAKLANTYPSRWWIVEYLVQCYWEWIFSWTISVLFYISGMIWISMVAKTFWTYWALLLDIDSSTSINMIAIIILFIFVLINLVWSKLMAKSENAIVITKITVLIIFTIATFFYIKPELLQIHNLFEDADVLYAIWLTFFAYEWFRVITNTVEDIENPQVNILKSMIISISIVMILYISISLAVFWTLSLTEVISAKDYALAEATKPIFWQIWFTIMAITALISTSSSINANLYAIANVTYDMAKNWTLPKVYKKNIYNSNEWLLISFIFIWICIIFFDLSAIASIWAISMLFIHLLVHIWHLFKIKETKASKVLIYTTIIVITLTIILAYSYSSKHINHIWYLLLASFVLAFVIEIILRLTLNRTIKANIKVNKIKQ